MMVSAPRDLAEHTVRALRSGIPGLAELQSRFLACSDLYEQGLDAEAGRALTEFLPVLNDFALFCAAVFENSLPHLAPASCAALEALNHRLETALESMLATAAAGDVLRTADTLRLDLCALLDDYRRHFELLARQWENAAPA